MTGMAIIEKLEKNLPLVSGNPSPNATATVVWGFLAGATIIGALIAGAAIDLAKSVARKGPKQ